MNCVRSLLTAISFIVALCPSIGLAAEWIKITKPLPDVSVTLKVGDEFRVRSSLGTGDDKMYTIDIGGRVAAVRASDVELVGPERMAVLEKDWQTNRQANPPKAARPSLDPESQALVDRLKREARILRQQQAELEAQLRKTPRTTNFHRLKPGETIGDIFAKRVGPGPNPDYEALAKQIQRIRHAVNAKNKQVLDFIDDSVDGRKAAVEASKKADALEAEEKGKVLAVLKKRCADPRAVADRLVAVLLEEKAILEAAAVGGVEAIDPRKALLYKAMVLDMSIAANDRDKVARAQPSMRFCSVNYRFKFVTDAGLVRFNQGYVLLCNIDGVWWTLQINVDGLAPYWQSYEHPLATPTLWRKVVEDYKDSAPVSPSGN